MKPKREFMRQLAMYGVIGGCSALLDILLFTLLYSALMLNEFIANIISTHFGIALSFTLNSNFNFRKTDRLLFRALSFYLTGVAGLALSEGLIWLGNHMRLRVVAVKVATVFIVAVLQFTVNKLVAFKK
jgi:putative flippase GtrA